MNTCPKCGTSQEPGSVFCKACHYYFRFTERHSGDIKSRQTAPQVVSTQAQLGEKIEHNFAKARQESTNKRSSDVRPFEPTSPPRSKPSSSFSKYLILFLLACVVALGFFWISNKTEADPAAALYAQAESLYSSNKYSAARELYEHFLAENPEHELATVVQKRLQQFPEDNPVLDQQAQQLQELLSKAENAVLMQRFLTPEDENAARYIRQVLAIDPQNPKAIELQSRILGFYGQKAAQAVSDGDFPAATIHYENMLTIDPGHRYATTQLAKVNEAVAKEKLDTYIYQTESKIQKRELQLVENQIDERQEKLKQLEQEQISLEAKLATLNDKQKEDQQNPADNTSFDESASQPLVDNRTSDVKDSRTIENRASIAQPSATNTKLIQSPSQDILEGLTDAPANVTAALIVKLISLDTGINTHDGPISIYVLGDSQVAKELQSAVGLEIGNGFISRVQGGSKLPNYKPTILYIGDEKQSNIALIYSRAKDVLSISANPRIIANGTTLGLGIGKDRKPKIFLNRASSDEEGRLWSAEIYQFVTSFN